ncbi:glycoside hydrolase family 2 [Pseudoduganella sp. FT25W]|uniref:beta-galactosidase n=1 Tax=Duganella alba TaxID=2666081 RepID=A0A6L5QI21_9BURK|nr:glycoside hydrolase family 2 TIM barrel-domain containing protein [Duganella alba]MRX09463.1 glycoside hydrolase family 2 [Duganella alba]MRX17640.1 glycoside hydrolase family 2 [Duganella alba]
MHWLLSAFLLALSSQCFAEPTQIQYLSGVDKDHRVDWDFQVNGGRNAGVWKKIPVPSNWEMEGFGTYRYSNDWQKDPAPDNTGLYRYRFTVPADWRGKQIDIVFGGSMTDTLVKINGQPAGPVHQGGFYEFRYDVTRLLKQGENNQLKVTVQRYSANASVNRAERSSDYWLFSGIYRPVWLEAKPQTNIDRVSLDARHTGDFSADVFVAGATSGKVSARIATLDGAPLGKEIRADVVDGKAHLSGHVDRIVPWTAENPQRYQVRFALLSGGKVVHDVSRIIGFRTMELRPRDGVYVNGHKVRLKGSNRHSIWPTSGRTTSKALSYQDARLMKEMNMNAVRMSHYPPDPHFLDVADEVGLYVIDELTGWQKAYDTDVATPLVKELVQRDQHHPSILFWANGNEGGFNRDLDRLYAGWDAQKRPVIHPWENFGGIDTAHYPTYNCCATSLFNGRDVFMPTEFLHGLYDGGAGASLNDWWNAMLANPLSAGGFIWAFVDEGIVRDDRNGAIDVAGNLAPDGILGPYREKEGSFFAIKKIWSPLYLPLSEMASLPPTFDGSITLENRYDFTNLNQLKLRWELVRLGLGEGHIVTAQGSIKAPDVAAGMRGVASIALPRDWSKQDALYISATDRDGREIYKWSWMIATPQQVAERMRAPAGPAPASVTELADSYQLQAGTLSTVIDKATGYLRELKKDGVVAPLTNGPRLVAGKAELKHIHAAREGGDVVVSAEYTGNLRKVNWRLGSDGRLSVNYGYQMEGSRYVDALGVTFDYPESQVTSMRWLGRGPYRVWKNRTQGEEFDVWQKDYNDTVSGLSWNYPEFKGFHDKVYWATLKTKNLPITFINHVDDIALGMFTPREASGEGFEPKGTHIDFQPGDISFLNTILPIGTKFNPPGEMGPSAQQARTPNLGIWLENTIDIVVGDSAR